MAQQKKIPTKEKIMKAAAKLFSERGYDKVTTREIAKAAGINSASIYYHFTSKDELLKSLYKFYAEEHRKAAPDLDELLRLAETNPPHEVLMRAEFHFNKRIRKMLDQILVTAAREICGDPESEGCIKDNIFGGIENILRPLLQRMMELKKIETFDIDIFLRLVSYYCFSAAALNNSIFRQSVAEYQSGLALLFSMVASTGKP